MADSMTKQQIHAFLIIIIIIAAIAVVATSTIVTPVFAIKKFLRLHD
jgi:hypothetical protein